MICTFYSHTIGFEKVKEIAERTIPNSSISVTENENGITGILEVKGGLFGVSKKVKIIYRERAKPSYRIPEVDDSPLTANLKGLYGYVNGLSCNNEKIKGLFLQKILTINCEFSVQQVQGELKEMKPLLSNWAKELEAILFVQPNTIISKAKGQHFLDSNLNLILDNQGNCEIDHLAVNIESKYFDGEQDQLTEDQVSRKNKNEKVITSQQIKANTHLPCVPSEAEVNVRTAEEIAQRVTILAITNLVAFNGITGEQAIGFLEKYGLIDLATPNEKEFLADPTEAKKSQETWKCEGIWTLMWAIQKVEDLGFPNQLCDLGNIAPENYPIAPDRDPNDFIRSIHSIRSAKEILDANDLYYRLDWACVDCRIHGQEMTAVHPGVVYERHYALNWLINYRGQEWDEVSCDT